jgi:glycosyltransferase 2 family protein
MLRRRLQGGRARWLLRVAISIAIVTYILVDVDTEDLVRTLAGVRRAPLVAAVALYLVGQALSAYKWSLLGRSVGFARPVGEYARFYFIGMFFNLFGPSTIGGDVVRALYLADGHHAGLAINSVVFDRVSGLALLTALGAVALIAFPQYGLPWPLTASLVAGGLLLALGWWMCPRLVRLLPARNRLRRQVEVELGPFWRDRALLARVAVVSLVFHLTQVGVQYVLARAAGVALPFSYCLVFHPVISLMTALPLSVAGLGVREGGYLYFLTRIDVDDAYAVTLGLLWFAVTVMAGLVGGALFVAAGAELPRVRAKAAAPADVSAA